MDEPPTIETAGTEAATTEAATTELGIDVVQLSRIREALAHFGERFARRILTPQEAAYVRSSAERLGGRWAAKEAVSKVLGLGVRGVGWREIEIVRLPTGQPAVRLHGRARARAEQLGMGRIAVSISHDRELAAAVATATRTAGGAYVFPPDIETRLDERERTLLARLERVRGLADEWHQASAALTAGGPAEPMTAAADRAEGEDRR